MKPRKITQIGTLKMVRKPMPPVGKVIVPKKTKVLRKRARVLEDDPLL